jgi:uncharacterized protein
MFIGLHELEQHTVRFKLDIPSGQIEYDTKIAQASPLHAEGTAQLISHSLGEIRVQGDLKVTVEATCDRCLEPAHFPLESKFDLVYMPASGTKAGPDAEIDQAGVEVGYYEGNGLALEDVFREVVLLALPMQLVCKEECEGICPACGQNRNQIDCGCREQASDDRWNKLKRLRAEIGPHH